MPKNKFKSKDRVTFQLVHRSQKDPLYCDETAPQYVFKPVEEKPKNKKDEEKRKEEQRKYGIYFDDDYDYLKHLQPIEGFSGYEMEEVSFVNRKKDEKKNEVNEELVDEELENKSSKPKVLLPSSLFASEFEEEVGLLNRNPPQSGLNLDLDPDIVAAMDDDFDFSDPENMLEDDFIMKANMLDSDEELGENCNQRRRGHSFNEEDEDRFLAEEQDDVGSMGGFSDDGDDTKTRFTNYSMSSSIIRRNEQLTLLDDKFEKMFAEYDDEQMGALDCEEIEGQLQTDSPLIDEVSKEMEDFPTDSCKISEKEKEIILKTAETNDEDEPAEEMDRLEIKPKDFWDCESILSTYSNVYNHPKLIKEPPRVSKIKLKNGIPVINNKLTKSNLNMLINNKDDSHSDIGSVLSSVSRLSLSLRPKDETPEERKSRKNLIKEVRKERREERKMNKLAFKEEKKRYEKQFLTRRSNPQTVAL